MASESGLPRRKAEEALVQQWEPFARRLVERFAGLAEREDLEQIARLALWQAACRFDPARGFHFTTFALPTILGALRRYVRDQAHVGGIPRRWWELRPRLKREMESLADTLGRDPAIPELAAHLEVSEEDVAGALWIHELCRPLSLDGVANRYEEGATTPWAERIGTVDPRLEEVERRLVVGGALEGLPERLRAILRRRYFQGQTQQEVGRALGISQMHVSRLEKKALACLQEALHGA